MLQEQLSSMYRDTVRHVVETIWRITLAKALSLSVLPSMPCSRHLLRRRCRPKTGCLCKGEARGGPNMPCSLIW